MPEVKTENIVRELLEGVATGALGRPGDRFMTTRELAARKKISLKTAFRILGRLKEDGVLEKSGRCHRIAPLLPQNRTENSRMLLGFMATCLESPYFAKLACDAEELAHSVGAGLIIASSNYDFETECERLRMFCRQGVSGILICPWASTPEQEAFYDTLPVPYVMLGRRLETVECDAVLVNNQKAAQKMARHLVSQGIREFAYIGQAGKLNDQRLLGFRAGLMEQGFSLPENRIVRADYNSPDQCRSAILKLLKKRGRGPMGIFCYHDLFATRTINLCHELGIAVPDDVAVAGFDDLPVASEIYPALTSVSYPVKDMARLAFESLYARIKFKTLRGGVCRYLDSKIVVRNSTLLQK
ncbi:MAG: HTH-type transcriptional regulator DegA [Lentisphaerae bacterium ADurb.Bin242]|nr:MAG: HTH-type transcriptional regulator DegA [Lentisphaerae bacterium ADurb.Bin242]